MGGEEGCRTRSSGPGSGIQWLICKTMLEVVGERGYADATVEDVVNRGACSRAGFYDHFESKQACFEFAYRTEAERLCAVMLEPCAADASWTEGLIEAVRRLLEFVAAEPSTAQALLLGSRAMEDSLAAVQHEVVERLAHALDGARRLPGSRHSAPPLTATMMIGAVENLLVGLLSSGESAKAPSLLGDLIYLIVQSYFDEDAAFAAMDAAKAAGT
jgi:AcrR family transcriptional regulator